MSIIREFTVEEHEEAGWVGLKPTWFSNADPTTGPGVPHDMLEHFCRQEGPVQGELAAFGAFILLRLEQGAIPRMVAYDEKEVLVRDVMSVLRDMCEYDLPVPDHRVSRKLGEQGEWAETIIEDAVFVAIERTKAQLAEDGILDNHEHLLTRAMGQTYVAWIRHGYRQAMRRYQNVDLYYLGNTFFKKVGEKLDRLLRSDMLQLGDRVRVALDVHRHDILVKVNGNDASDFGYFA